MATEPYNNFDMQVRPVHAPTQGGRTYKMEAIQQPVRARMCGFGDKDRRPITPPPCVRLRIFDEHGQEINVNDINSEFFVLGVDLWSSDATQQVSLVKHSSNSPAMSISAATTTSFPPPQDRLFAFIPAPAHLNIGGGLQANVLPLVVQPPSNYPSTAAYPPSNYPGSGFSHSNGPAPAVSTSAGLAVAAYGGMNGFPTQHAVAPQPLVSPTGQSYGYTMGMQMHALPVATTSTSGQHTRNLIGSLAVSASKLNDEHGRPGIWFVLQDLSVRTEGIFRLRFTFVDVMDPAHPDRPNRNASPILATVFSDPFQVYSAKKFPGVIESTPLSKAFAGQGVKIPIRKDIKNVANAGEYANDNDDPASL